MRRRKKPYGKIAILCIATLLVTYGMGKYFESLYLKYADYGGVQPVITQPIDEVKPSEGDLTSTEYVTQMGFYVYLIQNGVYSVEGGAKSQANLLEMDGFKTCVFYEDNYRIVSGIYLDKDKALNQIEEQRELGYENFLLEVEVPEFVYKVYNEEEKEDLERIISKFKKTIHNAQTYFDKLDDYQEIDISLINYEGEEDQVKEVINVIECYYSWQNSQDEGLENVFLGTLIKYLRNIQ